MLYLKQASLLLYSGIAVTTAIPLNLGQLLGNLEQTVLRWQSTDPKTIQDEQIIINTNGTNLYDRYSIVSLIPREEYEHWLRTESEYAFEAIIRNTGGYGPGLDDVLPGAVIASPSKSHPNYYYQV